MFPVAEVLLTTGLFVVYHNNNDDDDNNKTAVALKHNTHCITLRVVCLFHVGVPMIVRVH